MMYNINRLKLLECLARSAYEAEAEAPLSNKARVLVAQLAAVIDYERAGNGDPLVNQISISASYLLKDLETDDHAGVLSNIRVITHIIRKMVKIAE